jgi:hypothetical protein
VASTERCGNGFREVKLETDSSGQVKLRYWAPGVISKEKVLLTVKAQEPCSTKACPSGEKKGETQPDPTLTIKPNVLIGTAAKARTVPFPLEAAEDLARWTRFSGLDKFKEFLAHQGVEHLISTAITTMFEAEAELPVAGAAIIHEYNSLNTEEIGFMAVILNAFGVRARGLGVESPGVSTRPGPIPGRPFLLAFAADNGPFAIDPGGLTWGYGKALSKRLGNIGGETMHLRVYEVSYCSQGLECGPGYSGVLKQRYDGLHPYLYFKFTADSEGLEIFTDDFIVPYSAETWMQTQFGG